MSQELQIFIFGHSITQGFWDTKGGWVQRLRTELDERSLDKPDDYYYEVHNLGVSGDDSFDILDRFEPEIEARLYEGSENAILIQIGVNDIQYLEDEGDYRITKGEFRENIRTLLQKAEKYSDEILFVSDGYENIDGKIPWAPERIINDERLEEFVEIAEDVCKKEGVEFLNLREIFDKEEFVIMLEDGSHPSNKGHERIKEEVERKMREIDVIEF